MLFIVKQRAIALALGASTALMSGATFSSVWVFEPSVSLDLRVDDNFYLVPIENGSLTALRAVGDLGFSRRTQTSSITGLARIDSLLTSESQIGDGGLDSNKILRIENRFRGPRSRSGFSLGFTEDTPSRDIAADISDEASSATDTTVLETQSFSSNVDRLESVVGFFYDYDVTRRLEFGVDVKGTLVSHDLPSAQDAIFDRYLELFKNGLIEGEPLGFNEVTIDDVGVFSPTGELDDYREIELTLGQRYKLTPISTFTSTLRFSRNEADVEPATSFPFEALIPDAQVPEIRRQPRQETINTTNRLTLGYERFITPVLQIGIDVGAYLNTSETNDTRPDVAVIEDETDGWLAGISADYDAGLTRFNASFKVDVQPSSAGAAVETNELIGVVRRTLTPRLSVSMQARAFEPDRLRANADPVDGDRFARRFISFEPRVRWQYARNWTVSAAYRYRRQKALVDPAPAQSNAVLFAVTYTPPSKVRDAARARGL